MPEATAVRIATCERMLGASNGTQSENTADIRMPTTKPTNTTLAALAGPKARLERSVTRKANGKVNAPQVNQSPMGKWTRMFDATTTNDMAAMGRASVRRPVVMTRQFPSVM